MIAISTVSAKRVLAQPLGDLVVAQDQGKRVGRIDFVLSCAAKLQGTVLS